MTVYRAKENFDLPELDLLSYLFESSHCLAKEDTIIHLEAGNPSVLYTKADARLYTKRLAHTLRNRFDIGLHGLGTDVVTVISSGQAYLPIAFYGVLAAGGVYSAASSAFTPTELARQVKDGASNLIICSKDVIGVAKEAAKLCNVPMERVVVLESDPIWRMWKVTDDEENLVGWQKLDWERVTDKQVLETRPITLLYSSGTTGVPKGVPLTSWNMVSEAYIPAVMLRQHLAHLEDLGHPSFEYRTLAHLPAAHVAGVQGYFVNPFCNGGLTVWTPRFDFALFLHYNRTFRITFFFTVPPIYLLIAKSPLVTDQFQNVRWAFSGAAPMGPELQRAASAKLSMGHDVWVAQTWGLSETTGSVTIQPWGERDETGSVSPIMPNCEVRVVDDEGMDVPAGKEGEILMKGPVVFKGYHKNVTVTQESFKDGWFCTGDVGLVKDSKVYIVDRKKELIKYKGMQVAPAELEALLIAHDQIADAAVIGVAGMGKDEGTEVPRAYVVADKAQISEEQIKHYVAQNASRHKQLRGGVVFLETIPKSPSGKILRKELREMAGREAKAKL